MYMIYKQDSGFQYNLHIVRELIESIRYYNYFDKHVNTFPLNHRENFTTLSIINV